MVEAFQPDLILFDGLGDVVCGGFSTPLRAKVADTAYIVTTSDYMSIYAANNICGCIRKHADRGGCRLGGLIFNERSALSDSTPVEAFARAIGSGVIGRIPQDDAISRAELTRSTVIESAPDAPSAAAFAGLARFTLSNESGTVPLPMDAEALEAVGDEIARRRMGAMQP